MTSNLYSHGLHLCQERFEHFDEARSIFERVVVDQPWNSINKDFQKYQSTWKAVTFRLSGRDDQLLMDQYPAMQKVIEYFRCPVRTVAYYRAEPGLRLHAHIDMSGHLGFNRLRFHVPVKTNPRAIMLMGGQRRPFHLGEGQLWALDTSHLHAVENNGDSERVHLMIEVEVNDWVWRLLPGRDLRYYLHMGRFFAVDVPRALVRRKMATWGIVKHSGYE